MFLTYYPGNDETKKKWLDEIRKDCEVLGLSLPVVKRFNNNDADDDDISCIIIKYVQNTMHDYEVKGVPNQGVDCFVS